MLMLAAFTLIAFAAALPGAILRPGAWYRGLDKPSWRPPDWLFAPVWTFLYATIALAGWLVWREAGMQGAVLPLTAYMVQLVLNASWSPIFFGLHRPDLAFFEIIVLWIAVVSTIFLFYPVHAGAALLLLPYLAWVSFAAVLNGSIWQRNPAPGEERPR